MFCWIPLRVIRLRNSSFRKTSAYILRLQNDTSIHATSWPKKTSQGVAASYTASTLEPKWVLTLIIFYTRINNHDLCGIDDCKA